METQQKQAFAQSTQAALAAAQRCVMCGLCNAHCPTYLQTRKEQQSPRGRIALAQWILKGSHTLSDEAYTAMTDCLGCRQCEAVCPSKVHYHQIWSTALAATTAAQARKPGLTQRLSAFNRSGLGKGALKTYQLSGAQWLARKTGVLRLLGLKHADLAIPYINTLLTPLAENYPAHVEQSGVVALFSGCLSDAFDADAAHAAIRILNRLGLRVEIPKRQTCCGAIDLHSGDQEGFLFKARENIQALTENSSRYQAILGLNSGCLSTLRDYRETVPARDAQERKTGLHFGNKLTDALSYLNGLKSVWSKRAIAPLNKTVVIHQPCTAKNVLHNTGEVRQFLSRIPGLEIVDASPAYTCCGAAGIRMLDPNAVQLQLQKEALDSLLGAKPDIIVSTNIGCSLFLTAGLAESGRKIPVMHPLTLMDRQLA